MALPVYQTSATSDNASSTNHVVTMPSGIVSGDFLLAVLSNTNQTLSFTNPAGWTSVPNVTNVAGGAGAEGQTTHAAYRIADGSETASYTWTTGSAVASGAIAARYSPANATPIGGSGSQANADNNTVTAPSITLADAGSLTLFIASCRAAAAYTPPASFTERIDYNGTSADVQLTLADYAFGTTGASGTVAATTSGLPDSVGALIEIKGSVAGPSNTGNFFQFF